MNDTPQVAVHPTYASDSNDVVVWRFKGREVITFGASLGGGFLLFGLLYQTGLGLILSLLISSAVPALTLVILLLFVSDKPKGYFSHWIEGVVLSIRGRALFSPVETTSHHE